LAIQLAEAHIFAFTIPLCPGGLCDLAAILNLTGRLLPAGDFDLRPTCDTLLCHKMGTKTFDTVTVRELRTKWVLVCKLVKNGRSILVTKDGEPIMKLSPPAEQAETKVAWPDFLGRALVISGGKITGSNAVLEERASHKW
jgi:antitoxin (DNA-binding transcriptional repressor) of toxin-antitoxin stability system